MYLLNRRTVSRAKPYLLLHCNGADESTTFTDNSPEGHTFSAVNDSQIDTAQYKFNGASLLFDGTDDAIKTTDGDFNLSTNFTIDLFVRPTVVTGVQKCLAQFVGAGGKAWWFVYDPSQTSLRFTVYDSGNIVDLYGSTAMVVDTWYHAAMCKVGDEYGLYQDGVQVAHASDSSTTSIGLDDALYLGAFTNGAGDLAGHMDEIRICKSNPFNANPVVGLTDKIQVPQQPYPSWN